MFWGITHVNGHIDTVSNPYIIITKKECQNVRKAERSKKSAKLCPSGLYVLCALVSNQIAFSGKPALFAALNAANQACQLLVEEADKELNAIPHD